MTEREDLLLRLSRLLGAHRNIGPSRVGALVGCDGRFFKDINQRPGQEPRSVRRPTFDRVVQAFSDIWPDELAWPQDIPRPKAKTQPAAGDQLRRAS